MQMLTFPIYQVDAFSESMFSGNPAAVCPLEKWPDKSLLQCIAAENNLSETAFFVKEGNGFGLKWFTPEAEIDLCGHATLASAFILFQHLNYDKPIIEFYTNSGTLMVSRTGELLTLNFPAASIESIIVTPEVTNALRSEPNELWSAPGVLMAVFETEKEIVHLKPDFAAIKQLDCRILYVTAPGTDSDFVSRVFAPAVGVNEDPVTGSAHCYFTPYWAKRLNKKLMKARQVSARGGDLLCEDLGERVNLSGHAILYLKGQITVPM